MARDGGLHRLADPPDGVRDKLDAPIGIELSGRRHEPKVPLADQIDERYPTVLELLGYRDDESDVVAREPFLGGHIALERLARELHFLFAVEEGDPADLVEIEV